MAKSKGSNSSELDPAIKAMMQETFNIGKGAVMESVDTGRRDMYGQPIMEERLKDYEAYQDPRFAEVDTYTTMGERDALKFLGGNQFAETDRMNDLYGRMSNVCLLYTSPSPRDQRGSRMPSSA